MNQSIKLNPNQTQNPNPKPKPNKKIISRLPLHECVCIIDDQRLVPPHCRFVRVEIRPEQGNIWPGRFPAVANPERVQQKRRRDQLPRNVQEHRVPRVRGGRLRGDREPDVNEKLLVAARERENR